MSAKETHPAADRNSQPISVGLRSQIDLKTDGLLLLEIASGSGQHVGYLAPLFPNITFQPTEYDRGLFRSISAYAKDCITENIREPVFVDVSKPPEEWSIKLPPDGFDYMFNSNMMHITPWACSVGLFRAAGTFLKHRGLMFTYGPYAVEGVLTPESNVLFNESLKKRNHQWGVRDIVELKKLAADNGIKLKLTQEMPSNNKLLTWIKD